MMPSLAGRPVLNDTWGNGGGGDLELSDEVVLLGVTAASADRTSVISSASLMSAHQTVRTKLGQVPRWTDPSERG